MISPTLMDKLQQLHLPAFRDGLREQHSNPQYAELSFEERLLLLVDMECSRRLDHRTKYRIKLANFPMSASIEELDLSTERGLDRRLILELSQCNWIDQALNIILCGATGTGKSFLACAFGTAACRMGYSVRYLHTARFFSPLNMPARTAHISISCDRSPNLICSSWTIGCVTLFSLPRLKISSKSLTIVLANPPRSSFPRFLFRIGIPDFQTPLWRMPSLTARFIMLIVFHCLEIPKERSEDSAPFRTLRVEYS